MQGIGITRSVVERHYTQTLFIAAQVHRQLGDGAESAQYCSATLRRQLVHGELHVKRCYWCLPPLTGAEKQTRGDSWP